MLCTFFFFFALQVTITVRPLLALVGRILLLDGSLPEALMLVMSRAMKIHLFRASGFAVEQLGSSDCNN